MNTNTCRCPPASEQTSAKTHLQLSECECSCFTSQHHQNRRMASFICRTLVLLFICITLQEGCGFPLSERAELSAQAAPPHRVRTKRCSCSSWDDKECIYFCHLDIIWVNTPSKLLPYGLGSSQSGRRRRSVDRCECLNPADKTCSGFCHTRSDRPKEEKPASTNRSRLLESLRSVVKSNLAIAESVQSVMRSSGGVNRPQR